MLLNPDQIRPSQDFLKSATVRFIFKCLDEGKVENLPPTPIVRSDGNGRFVAIDGHNLIAVYAYYKKPVEVHVATSEDDGLPPTTEENRQRNAELKFKYSQCLEDARLTEEQEVYGFEDMIIKNRALFDR